MGTVHKEVPTEKELGLRSPVQSKTLCNFRYIIKPTAYNKSSSGASPCRGCAKAGKEISSQALPETVWRDQNNIITTARHDAYFRDKHVFHPSTSSQLSLAHALVWQSFCIASAMPRPPVKRRRQNSYTQQNLKRSPLPDPSPARKALEQKLAHKALGKRPKESDDSDELVTTRTSGRGRPRQEIYASGAVAKGDKPGGWPTKEQRISSIRDDTAEILSQRSRSVSRANSSASTQSTSAPSHQEIEPGNPFSASIPVPNLQKRKGSQAKPLFNGVSHTTQADVSVLGRIKPRKRQASILQLIENDDNQNSSIIDSDDEALFDPDGVSTPLPNGRKTTPALIAGNLGSLKRKRNVELSESAHVRSSSPSAPVAAQQVHLFSRTQQKKLSTTALAQGDKEIMAPPESSDEDDEATTNTARQAATKAPRRPLAPSTQQLQSLMPSKKQQQKSLRQRSARSEFEVPADSTENSVDEKAENEQDYSAFLPAKSRKAQKRPATRGKSTVGRGTKTGNKLQDKSKSTRSTSYTPSPAQIRAPLPLSSTKSGTQAKSPSKQDSAMRDKSTNIGSAVVKPTRGAKKRYGGSRNRTAGKENQPLPLLENTPGSDDAAEVGTIPSREDVADVADVKTWKRKWADIDDFDLEFEEVSVSTHGSSPNAR